MSNAIEQIAAGVLLVVCMAAYIAAIIGFVVLCNRLKDWFQGVPYVSMKQRERIRAWQQRQLIKHRDDRAFVPLMEPTESELAQEEAEIAAEIAARERRQAAKKEAAQPAQPTPEPPEILFENGKAIIRPYTRMSVPVSTMRLTFQDGTEWDISADVEFAGLSEEDFRVAYAAFTKTQAELRGIEAPPPLNSKFWRQGGL
jgi:hypothetical protein